jgi:hypothetical protein
MILHDDIENLFRTVPLLAAVPRGQWQVTHLGGITNRSYRLQAMDQDLVLRWPGASASRYLDRSAEPANARAGRRSWPGAARAGGRPRARLVHHGL